MTTRVDVQNAITAANQAEADLVTATNNLNSTAASIEAVLTTEIATFDAARSVYETALNAERANQGWNAVFGAYQDALTEVETKRAELRDTAKAFADEQFESGLS